MKMIHVSDLRLNSCYRGFGGSPEARKEELWDAFDRICLACENRQVGLLLLSGNIFSREPSFSDMERMKNMLASIAPVDVVWIAGSLDPIHENYSYAWYSWPENVHFIRGTETVYLENKGVYVTGMSRSDTEDPAVVNTLKAEATDALQVLMLCGDDEKLVLHRSRLAAKGYDFTALGGRQNASIREAERCAYAGSPEPLDENGTGVHGYVLVDVNKGSAAMSIEGIAKRKCKSAALFVTEQMSAADIKKTWRNNTKSNDRNTVFKLVLRGKMPAGADITLFEQLEGVVSVTDETVPAYDTAKLKTEHGNDLIGRFIESVEEADSPVKDRALEIGITALLKK